MSLRFLKKVAALLRSENWLETRIKGDLVITIEKQTSEGVETSEDRIENFMDGHKVDFVKNRVAFDLEWNSKDQTFDRDLYAFRAFHEAGVISVAVLLTRSASLNDVFRSLDVMKKIWCQYYLDGQASLSPSRWKKWWLPCTCSWYYAATY